MMEANSGDTSTTPLPSPTTQTPICLSSPLPSTPQWFPLWCQQKASWPSCWGWRHCAGGCPGCVWTVEAQGGMKGRVAVFWHQIPRFFFPLVLPPQTPPSCGFMAYLPVADFHLAMSGDLWQICCRYSDRGSRRKGISSRETVLDRMTHRGTCKFWGNLTPVGGPLRCERRACKIVQKIVWAN